MAGTYSASEIIGKNLFAKKAVELRRLPDLNSPVIYTVDPGQNVGVVYSYINAKNNNPLFWQFKDNAGRFYYSEHEPGLYSEKVIRDQGGQTTKEVEDSKKDKEKDIFDKINGTVKTVGLFFIGGYLITKVIK